MMSLRFFRREVILAVLLVASLGSSSCVSYFGVGARPQPAPGTQVTWPGVAFSEVRAFCYDYTAEKDPSFFIDGRMHAGVMDPRGVKLTGEQVGRLLGALTVSQDKQARTPCYRPHHAFVFYDARGQVVALFEMCFGCNKFRSTPGGLPEYVDTGVLYQLTGELGLPLGPNNAFYTDACRAGRAQLGQ
jgi:hypothetical protein